MSATIIQGGGKHGGLGGTGHGKHGRDAFNIIVGVPTPVPTPVPVPVYQPMQTIAHVQHIPREVKGQTTVQVPVTTKQQFQGTSPRTAQHLNTSASLGAVLQTALLCMCCHLTSSPCCVVFWFYHSLRSAAGVRQRTRLLRQCASGDAVVL